MRRPCSTQLGTSSPRWAMPPHHQGRRRPSQDEPGRALPALAQPPRVGHGGHPAPYKARAPRHPRHRVASWRRPRRAATCVRELGRDHWRSSFLIADYFDETGLPPSVLHQREFVGSTTMEVIFERAVQRGEIDPGRLSPRIASLPLDLVRHDMIMNRASVPDATLIEIVDHLFLPLVRQPQVARPRLPKRKERP